MVKHGTSNAKIMGLIPRDSKSWSNVKLTWMQCKSLWIKASAKCINVNVIKTTVLLSFIITLTPLFFCVFLFLSRSQPFDPFLSLSFSQILELVKGMHYQLACQKYFELTHNVRMLFILACCNWACFCQLRDSPAKSLQSPTIVVTSAISLKSKGICFL